MPDMTISDANSIGKLAANQGHTVWKPMLASTPPMKPSRANAPSIFILSPIRFTLVLQLNLRAFECNLHKTVYFRLCAPSLFQS